MRNDWVRPALIMLWMLLAATNVHAEEMGIVGVDNREPVDAREMPWRAVGHVNIASYRYRGLCTGTLVAPRVVVTAAHCLVFPWDRKPIPAKDIHFVAGVHKDEQAGHATASCTLFAPGALQATAKYNPDLPVQTVPLDAFVDDIAVIVLKDDISVEPVPPETDEVFEAGLSLAHAAYPANKRYRLMADQSCMLLERQRGVWFTTCDTYPASSGGPVFVTSGGKTKVAAVMLGHGDNFSLAWPVSRWNPFPLGGKCPSE